MLVVGRKAANLDKARTMAESALESGRALESFRRLVQAQGGDVRYVDEPTACRKAPLIENRARIRAGYLLGINAREGGETSVELGAGRARKKRTQLIMPWASKFTTRSAIRLKPVAVVHHSRQ